PLSSIRKVTIWGNHSATQYPDVFQAECGGQKVWPMINDTEWLEKIFIPTVQKRGAAIIEARGLSSAASAANAAIDHVRDWVHGSRDGDWLTMGIPSDGSYGIPEGVIYGYPVTTRNGSYTIVKGIEVSEFSRMTEVCELPLLVDVDTGFGASAFNVARTTRSLVKFGAAAMHIEDQVGAKRCGHRPGKELVSKDEMCDRIKAAVDARTDAGF